MPHSRTKKPCIQGKYLPFFVLSRTVRAPDGFLTTNHTLSQRTMAILSSVSSSNSSISSLTVYLRPQFLQPSETDRQALIKMIGPWHFLQNILTAFVPLHLVSAFLQKPFLVSKRHYTPLRAIVKRNMARLLASWWACGDVKTLTR